MTAPAPDGPQELGTGRRFGRYVAILSAAGVLLLGALITVPGTFAVVPIVFIAVLYISTNLGRSIGWLALVAPILTAIVWFAAAAFLIETTYGGDEEQEAAGWSVLFAILGIGFTVLVAEAGVIAGLIWRSAARRRAGAERPGTTANPVS